MELELGLGLPNQARSMMVKGLDLNCGYHNHGVVEMGKTNPGFVDHDQHDDEEVESNGLPLLLWSGQPNDEDGDGGCDKWRRFHLNHENNNEETEEIVLGWPPINSLRKDQLIHRHPSNRRSIPPARISMYVKVKMEGVPIGRKIDLRLFNSYQTLTDTLIDMFDKRNIKNASRHGDYTILYRDREGEWMLAGDHVPWGTFVESVQRMEILRNNN